MRDVRKSYIDMLTATAERIHKPVARKEASWGAVFGWPAAGAAYGIGKGLVSKSFEWGIPMGALLYFTKYIGIPAGIGYILGDTLATSTSPSKDDLRTAENNALAKETVNKTKELENMPSVKPIDRTPKDLSWIGGM